MDVIKVAAPLIIYFVLMFFVSFFINKSLNISYDKMPQSHLRLLATTLNWR